MSKLSVVLATYNEEKTIADCLRSVEDFADEIIVVDGTSLDKTVEIAKKFKAKTFIINNKLMFHANKQLALEKASNPWILQLDADERVTPELKKEILSIINLENNNINGYYISRKNYFLGKLLTKGGQYPDYVIRLVKNKHAHFPCQSVHEQIKVEGHIGYLNKDLLHFGNRDFSCYFKSANLYTTLTANDLVEKKVNLSLTNYLKYLIWLPMVTFFKIYIRHRGYIDGFPGFTFALLSGFHYPIAFIKYWEILKLRKLVSPLIK